MVGKAVPLSLTCPHLLGSRCDPGVTSLYIRLPIRELEPTAIQPTCEFPGEGTLEETEAL